jgi:hypothetical protein
MRLDQARENMLLARDVTDPNGRVLIKAGTRLTKRHIDALKAWGIPELKVRPPGSKGAGTARGDEDLALLRRSLDARFAMANLSHPAVAALYRYCLERAVQQAAGD